MQGTLIFGQNLFVGVAVVPGQVIEALAVLEIVVHYVVEDAGDRGGQKEDFNFLPGCLS